MLKAPPRGQKQTIHMTLRELINLRLSGRLIHNPNNRGNTGVLKSNVNKIAGDMNPLLLGTISATLKSDSVLQLIDGHSRVEALMKLYRGNDKQLIAVLDAQNPGVNVDIFNWTNRVTTYSGINDVIRHTSTNDLTTPEYALGKVWVEIRDRFELPDTLATSVMLIAMNLEKYGEGNISILTLPNSRIELNRMLKHVGRHPFSQTTLDALQRGLEKLSSLRKAIVTEGTVTARGSMSSAAKTLLNNASFSLGVLVGFVGDRKLDSSNIRRMATKCIRYAEAIIRYSHTFMKKGKGAIEDTKFYLTITPKKNRSKP